jgi:two-component system cell cycle sensor histidine kinase/response regulator CckA
MSAVSPEQDATDCTVLVVDDEDRMGVLVGRMVEKLGYPCAFATSGTEALSLLPQMPKLELLVTDLLMPDLDGRDLAKRVRAERPSVAILYMSGYTEKQLGGAPDGPLLCKPFHLAELRVALQDAIRAHRAAQ